MNATSGVVWSWRRLTSIVTGLATVVAVVLAARPARADDVALSVGLPALLPPAALRHPALVPAARFSGGAPAGFLLGVDGGYSYLLPSGRDKSSSAGSFGVAAGYEFGNGLGADIRYDDLGVRETVSPLQAVTFGARYALPFPVMPFVEARAGVEFDRLHPYFGASGAVGVAVPVARQLAFKLTARDWLSEPEGQVRSVITVQLGAAITFAGPRH